MAATYSSLIGVAVGGKYEVRRVLGAGGMGVVCEAVHLDLGKRVAVKLIDKSMKESELIVARFRREARAAGQINSEHIVDVFDVGADARVGLYMVMEYLTGEDLQSRLERDGRMDARTLVMISHQIARGLHKAHESGVIHRDLKPANVFLTERDNGQMLVKLLDFGVSKLVGDAPGSARITGTGTPIGTPLYMSPEQAEGKDDVDGRADIWSLGAVMYEALAGAAPFADRGSYHNTIVGILTSRPKLLYDAAPWVPPELARVVDAMLVHDRDARLPNAGVVAERLLESFPTVLPDGTGKHTAVIVSQAAAAVDATGDTELFTSASMRAAGNAMRRPESNPPLPPSRRDQPQQGSRPPRPPQEAVQTGVASPVNASSHHQAQSDEIPVFPAPMSSNKMLPAPSGHVLPPVSSSADAIGGRGPKTAPLLSAPPISSTPSPLTPAPSSADGVALMTPARIDPLPPSMANAMERAPSRAPTPLPPRPRRRSGLTFFMILVLIAAVGAGSYVVGRKAPSWGGWPRKTTQAPPVEAPPPQPTATSTATTFPAIATATMQVDDRPALPVEPLPQGTVVAPALETAAPSASVTPRVFKKLRQRAPKPEASGTPPEATTTE